MVKSRITASRRLRAQVKKHQKTRRGGHNGFSPRMRELNSGDVPWEMPSGGKSLFTIELWGGFIPENDGLVA
ncbi:hypothetical protein OUZ56_005021 [Daphnia magna]|uniref:Uncharacterized protein n=1 Tax=Daphnia magna TaxID=35525 RepID=A0ABQ9YRM6_9CRUS|nr:hypothetical protein OUZ56_005021 [Daphnia magna]